MSSTVWRLMTGLRWPVVHEQDTRRHVAQVVNPEVLDAGALASRLEGFPGSPMRGLTSFEPDVRAVGR
jgi:hypothetical protein